MGLIKRQLENEEHKYQVALSILVKAGAVVKCDTCGDYVDNRDDEASTYAYRIANSMIAQKDAQVEAFKGNSTGLRDLIKNVREDVNWECHCEEVMKE